MKPRLSIIIPIYNVAQYLRHCLQSVSDQGLEMCEIILVDDASTDNSKGICLEWCEEHPDFRLVCHDRNRGLSEARNTGLDEAQGEYITFIDSDDFIAPETISNCLDALNKADVVEYPVMIEHLSANARLWAPQPAMRSFSEWLGSDGYLHCYAWNKIYHRSLWQGVRFPPGKYFEDIFTIPHVLRRARRIVSIQQGLYYYCARTGSISRTRALHQFHDYAEAMGQLVQCFPAETSTALYIRALNGQRSYAQAGGKEVLVPYRPIPWSYILGAGLTFRQRLKALFYKATIHK